MVTSSGGFDDKAVASSTLNLIVPHIPSYGGDIWYVAPTGVDTNSGFTPETPFLTIAAAMTAAVAGDAISLKSGVYTESVNLNLVGLELWGEIGATIVGTLTLSADNCGVRGVIVAPAAAIGIVVTGNQCAVEDVAVIGTPTVAYDINGYQNRLSICKALGYTVTAFDVANYNNLLFRCIAQGADTATRGFYFSNAAADSCTLDNCISVGNTTSGYEFIAGTANTSVVRCHSGSGDGRWVDVDNANTFDGFTFDDVLHKEITLDGSGTYNLYQVTGVVQITYLYGIVETALPAATTAASLQLFPAGGAAIQLTSLAGSNISNLPVGSMIEKAQAAANAISVSDATLGFISEQAGLIFAKFAIGQKTAGIATYIRLNVTEAGASGAIHWVCQWLPLSDDGFLVAV